MSQKFNIVKCYQCLIYQVDIDKKSTNKWTCKLCGSKQSLKQVYFQGDSKECRLKVQALNEFKGKQEETNAELKLNNKYQEARYEHEQSSSFQNSTNINHSYDLNPKPFVSKWAKYLTQEDLLDDNNENCSDNENF